MSDVIEMPPIPTSPYRPRRNREGQAFVRRYCVTCRHGQEAACPILKDAATYRPGEAEFPLQWVRGGAAGVARCTAYRPLLDQGVIADLRQAELALA